MSASETTPCRAAGYSARSRAGCDIVLCERHFTARFCHGGPRLARSRGALQPEPGTPPRHLHGAPRRGGLPHLRGRFFWSRPFDL